MSKTAYEIESELRGSAVDRTGFGGRPELINFYVKSTSDLSALPVLDKLDVDALCCGKTVPVLTVLDDNKGTSTYVCSVDITKTEGVVTEIQFTPVNVGAWFVTFTVADGTWAFAESA